MRVIYEPRGRAREYSPLAVNLYKGCAGMCRYCWAPAVLRKTREEFAADTSPRDGILEKLVKDAADPASRAGRILMCFTCDPYPASGSEVTREALKILRDHKVSVLTKAGARAARDLDLLADMDAELGVTLSFVNECLREKWEPGASMLAERLWLLKKAKLAGVRTWVSVEPVVDAIEALWAINVLLPMTDEIRVGKLNHADIDIDWRAFGQVAERILKTTGKPYLIKRDLRKCME